METMLYEGDEIDLASAVEVLEIRQTLIKSLLSKNEALEEENKKLRSINGVHEIWITHETKVTSRLRDKLKRAESTIEFLLEE